MNIASNVTVQTPAENRDNVTSNDADEKDNLLQIASQQKGGSERFSPNHAITIRELTKNYGTRRALDHLTLSVQRGELFCMLGPNGGGKSTLFRILSTLLQPDHGEAEIAGYNVVTNPAAVRARIGVVFQAPSLDGKLTVRENLLCGGALYGLRGKELELRLRDAVPVVQLEERLHDRVETLSGGLQRRTEIAKCLLIRPEILLLDEPSTGLDPGARLDLWAALENLRRDRGVTAFCTTHLMDEAARADRVGIMNSGQLVALGTPNELTSALGGDVLSLSVRHSADQLAQRINQHDGPPSKLTHSSQVQESSGAQPQGLYGTLDEASTEATHQFATAVEFGTRPIVATVVEGEVRIEHPQAHQIAAQLAAQFSDEITAVRVARPTLEDVFVARTGRLFSAQHNE